MEVMERAIFPVLVRVTVLTVEVLAGSVPKLRELGETESAGAAFSAEPESGILAGLFRLELEITREPVAPAVLAGAERMVTFWVFPGGSSTRGFAGDRGETG